MILCIGATPAVQKVMVFREFANDSVNRAATTMDGAAGKSVNVAKVLQRLGANPVATGFLGGDRGDQIASILHENGIESNFIRVQTRTRECITVINESDGTQTELVEESQAVPAEAYNALLEVVQRRIVKARAVVLSGTLTPGAPVDFYRECVHFARQAGALAIVDAKGPPLESALTVSPDVVKPNRSELAATVDRSLASDSDLISAMRRLHEMGARQIVVTAGKQSTFAFDGTSFWKISAPTVNVVNPIGSGDAFTAALTWRLLEGDTLGEACRWGSAAGAANALTLMPGELNSEDIHRLQRTIEVQKLVT